MVFPGGVIVYFNKTYHRGESYDRSYSVTLRPDLVLQLKDEIYIFDAKFKLERLDIDILESNDEENGTPSGTTFKKADLYKMHTYRDAIRGCRGAYVLYPGEETQIFYVDETGSLEGVGALSCCVGRENGDLEDFVASIIHLFRHD